MFVCHFEAKPLTNLQWCTCWRSWKRTT